MENFLKTLPVAHRGLHDETKPENSLSAFSAALSAGYAIETDVRFTKDRQLVVFHDDTLLRMTGDPRAVADCTLRELSPLRLAGSDEPIPSFADFLFLLRDTPLLLEIKNMPKIKGAEVGRAILAEIERSGYRGEYAVQSFQPLYVGAFRKLSPKTACGLLYKAHFTAEESGGAVKRHILEHMSLNFWIKPSFLSCRVTDLSEKRVRRFRGEKFAWTVRSPEEEAIARAHGANIIFEGYLPKNHA